MPEVTKDNSHDIIVQPETRPISLELLATEVRGIYAGLIMVEAKCIEVDQRLLASLTQAKLNGQQWQALIILHRTLLYEYHDFLFASQHPSANPALRQLALEYDIPTRMWLHGVYAFLEVLRHHLPASLDFMLDFLYLSYSMMALLYETIPIFADTWIECLGEMSQYRMALEDEDIRDREVWTSNARNWYSKASDRAPTIGRLYHHHAILATNVLQELFLRSKSLCVANPFNPARISILMLFDPVLILTGKHQRKLPTLDTHFVRVHGLLFKQIMERFDGEVTQFLRLLNLQIRRTTSSFIEQGYLIAISNICAMLDFGSKDNALIKAVEGIPTTIADEKADISFERSRHLHHKTLAVILEQAGDPKVLPFLHVVLAFMRYISHSPCAMDLWEAQLPWVQLTTTLNALIDHFSERVKHDKFPEPAEDDWCPFPEDYAMRGLLWTRDYFPECWFIKEVEDDEKSLEKALMTPQRKERILWLAYHVANCGNSPIHWDSTTRMFSVECADKVVGEGAYQRGVR
jgi:hypothetical protein